MGRDDDECGHRLRDDKVRGEGGGKRKAKAGRRP